MRDRVVEHVATAASPPAGAAGRRRANHKPGVRLALGLTLLAAEVLLLLTRFSGQLLLESPHAWARVLANARIVPQIALAAVTAALLFGRERFRREVTQITREQPPRGVPWPLVAAQLVAFATLYALTGALFEHAAEETLAAALPLVFGWLAACLATVTAWGLVLHPASVWRRLLTRTGGIATAAVVIGGAAWGAGELAARTLWEPLSQATFAAASGVLALVTDPLVVDAGALTFGTTRFAVRVAPQCSGFEGIGLTWVFVATYLWLFRTTLRFPHALLLLPLATVVMWCANVGRLAGLVALGTWVSPDAAAEGFHSTAGMVLLCAVSIGIIAVSRRLAFFNAGDPVGAGDGSSATAAYLVPLLAVVATAMLTEAIAPGSPQLQPLRLVAGGLLLWVYRREHAGNEWRGSLAACAIGALVALVWLGLAPAHRDVASLAPAPAGIWFALRAAGAVLVTPVIEELAFRGYLLRRLTRADFESVPMGQGSWAALLASSLLFGVLHQHWLAGTIAGLGYAAAVARRGRLADAILAHATTNALLVAHALAGGEWSL